MDIRQCTKCNEKFDADLIKNERQKSRCNKCHLEYKRKWRDSKNPKHKFKKELAKQNKKQCTKCNEIKNLNEFWKSKYAYLGTKAECNKCSLQYGLKFINYNKERNKTPKANNYIDFCFLATGEIYCHVLNLDHLISFTKTKVEERFTFKNHLMREEFGQLRTG